MVKDLVEVMELYKWFPVRGGIFRRVKKYVRAVDGVSFSIKRGETFGVVGESGCGKTTLGRTVIRLAEPTSGSIFFDGREITSLRGREAKEYKKKMQIVFQDPYASLDPRQTVGSAIMEPMFVHHMVREKDEAKKRAETLLEQVGLNADHFSRFPHEFSGGQRQRIAIARALALNPEFIVLDEPTSSLDVSVQSQILNLLLSLRRELNLTYMFISHNLAVIRQMCHRTAVMYLGRIVEIAETSRLFENPKHPYTVALLRSVPLPDPNKRKMLVSLEGDVPSPVDIPSGCRFRTRCKFATQLCREKAPNLIEIEKGHWVECHYDIDFSTNVIKATNS
jgi:oligopeptide/dipeptide ABC transporter ATP-binding protein